jgi:hypothetical protein
MTVSDGQAGWVRVARIVEIARKVLVSMNSDGTAAARHIGAVAESTLLVESALARTSR